MTPQILVRFASPISLRMAVRSRVPSVPGQSHNQIFSALPIFILIDAFQRTITAYLPPVPRGILLYESVDFSSASGDSMDDHAARVLQVLGSDPATALQALIDGGTIPNPPKRVPREVAHWRIALVLDQAGRLAQVESLIAGLPQPQYSVASAAWAGMSAIARRSPLVLAVAAALGYSDAEMDALFIASDSISA